MMPLTVELLTEFFDAMKNPLTKDRYVKRLDVFFRHIGMEGSTLEERARDFASKVKGFSVGYVCDQRVYASPEGEG